MLGISLAPCVSSWDRSTTQEARTPSFEGLPPGTAAPTKFAALDRHGPTPWSSLGDRRTLKNSDKLGEELDPVWRLELEQACELEREAPGEKLRISAEERVSTIRVHHIEIASRPV